MRAVTDSHASGVDRTTQDPTSALRGMVHTDSTTPRGRSICLQQRGPAWPVWSLCLYVTCIGVSHCSVTLRLTPRRRHTSCFLILAGRVGLADAFPNVYNQDWFFVLEALRRPDVCLSEAFLRPRPPTRRRAAAPARMHGPDRRRSGRPPRLVRLQAQQNRTPAKRSAAGVVCGAGRINVPPWGRQRTSHGLGLRRLACRGPSYLRNCSYGHAAQENRSRFQFVVFIAPTYDVGGHVHVAVSPVSSWKPSG